MYWDKDKWLLDNQKEFDDYCTLIDELKAKSLAYGLIIKLKIKTIDKNVEIQILLKWYQLL